jgi:hypothetical protein
VNGNISNADGIEIEIASTADATTLLFRTWADFLYVNDSGTNTVYINRGGVASQ